MAPCFVTLLLPPPPQVAYTSSNGVANGGVHPEATTHGEATRPSSAASTQPGSKADPDMQVSGVREPEGRGGAGCTGVATCKWSSAVVEQV